MTFDNLHGHTNHRDGLLPASIDVGWFVRPAPAEAEHQDGSQQGMSSAAQMEEAPSIVPEHLNPGHTIGGQPLRRTKSESASPSWNNTRTTRPRSSSNTGSRKVGFLRSIFGGHGSREKLHRDHSNSAEAVPNKARSRRSSTVISSEHARVTESDHVGREAIITGSNNSTTNTGDNRQPNGFSRTETDVTSSTSSQDNDQLRQFLEYYKRSGKTMNGFEPKNKHSSSFIANDRHSQLNQPENSKFTLHSALKKLDSSESSISSELSSHTSTPPSPIVPPASHKIGSFLKKVTSYGLPSGSHDNDNTNIQSRPPRYNFDGTRHETTSKNKAIPGLQNMRPLKHVSFATSTYFNDPPQQICSKNPRKGEVEVKDDGSVVIHRLTPEQRREIMKSSSSGVVVGGTGQLKLLNAQQQELLQDKYLAKSGPMTKSEEDLVNGNQRRNIEMAASEAAAEARGKNPTPGSTGNTDEEVLVNVMASHLTIDKPMTVRRNASATNVLSQMANMGNSDDDGLDDLVLPPPNIKIPHDVVYTRCCHLREILPIPATLRQLKKGSTDPIPLLQLRNPRPSMVEVWSFSDFLRIAPVICLSLDGVQLNIDMLKIILSALVFNSRFEKLSMRNTPLDSEGWKVLCYFITKCKSLISLDLTMVPSIKTNVQKPSKSSLKINLNRMEADLNNRTALNWDLLTAVLAARGGIEELIVSGAKMSLAHFENFISLACISTERLGLAYNDLTTEQCTLLADWIVSSSIMGLDIGYNDLHGKLSLFSNSVLEKVRSLHGKNQFKFLSMNGCNLSVEPNSNSNTNEFLGLLSTLCYAENLKFLDISNNPKIFPHCLPTLVHCLPVYVNLVRLHVDYNELSTTNVVTLAEVLPLCLRLAHFSMIGVKLNAVAVNALADAIRKSSSLITLDLDYDDIPEHLKEKISLYTMSNVQNQLDKVKEIGNENGNEGKSPNKQLNNLQVQLSDLLTDEYKDSEDHYKLIENFVVKLSEARAKIHKVVQDLFTLRMDQQLNFEGKEALIRLCLVDSSFEKGLRLLKQRYYRLAVHSNELQKSKTEIPKPLSNIFGVPLQASNLLDHSSSSTSSEFEKSGHLALLPFGSAAIDKDKRNADDTVEFREDEDEDASYINPFREKYNIVKNELRQEHMEEDLKPIVDKEVLCNAAATLDSDFIKDLLVKNDVNTIVGVIDELHSKGYHLHHIFKKQNLAPGNFDINKELHKEYGITEADYAKQSLDEIKPKFQPPEGKQPSDTDMNEMDKAYDQVLDQIVKDRKERETR